MTLMLLPVGDCLECIRIMILDIMEGPIYLDRRGEMLDTLPSLSYISQDAVWCKDADIRTMRFTQSVL
jgi:hypothetical protein